MPILNDNDDFIVTKKILGPDVEVITIDNLLYDIDDIKKKSELFEGQYTYDAYPGTKKILLGNDDYNNVKLSSEVNNIRKYIIDNLSNELYKLEKYIDGKNHVLTSCLYGNVSVDPKLLTRLQSQPHTDYGSAAPELEHHDIYAIIVYLNEDENSHGGTGFYKHIASGMISVHNEIQDNIFIDESMKVKNPIYFSDTNDVWELVELVSMKKNRAVIYKTNTIHNAYIKDLSKFNDEGRHTLNFFIIYEKNV